MSTGAGQWLAQARLRLKARLPTPDSLQGNRWLSWLGPSLYHPRLWHMSRRGLALGMAIGIFFGFLIPIAQIPFSAATAVALRANLPVAMVSTLVAVRSADDPEPLVASGRVAGLITEQPIGDNGFGFDPVMYIPEFGQTFAQLPNEVKNANSHRGRAARAMLALMRERWYPDAAA